MTIEEFYSLTAQIKIQSDWIEQEFNLKPTKVLIGQKTYNNIFELSQKSSHSLFLSLIELQTHRTILGMRIVLDNNLHGDEAEVVFPIRKRLGI